MKIGKVNIELDKSIKTPKQFSKVLILLIMLFAMFNIEIYIIVDIIYHKALHANNIIMALITVIIGSLIPYFAKSFLETKEERLIQLRNRHLELQSNCGGFDNYFVGNNNIYDVSTPVENIDTNEGLG